MDVKISLVAALLMISCSPETKRESSAELDFTITGKDLYEQNCANCHGGDGKLGNSGAFDLTKTALTRAEIEEVILEGRKAMPPFQELIANPTHLDSLVNYVEKFKE